MLTTVALRSETRQRELLGPELVGFKTVEKVFQSGQEHIQALTRVSFSIHAGEFVSVVGPSGCGKTTMLNLIAGLDFPSSGQVTMRGEAVKSPITDVGIVFQEATLLDWRSVIGNVMIQAKIRRLAWDEHRKKAEDLLNNLGLSRFHDAYPSQLSGGMKQRVSLARALVHSPPLLLLDEPFSALDAFTRDKLNIDLQHLCLQTKTTAFFITHSIVDAVFLGDRVVVMTPSPGQVAAVIDVDLPKPRDLKIRESPEFTNYVGHIRTIFERTGVL